MWSVLSYYQQSKSYGLSILESYLIIGSGLSVGFAASQIKISSFLYALAIINLIFFKERMEVGRNFKLLLQLGDNSYGIYYVHMLWIMVTDKILPFFILPNHNFLIVYQFVQLTLTITLSIATIYIVKKLTGPKAASKLLGF